MVDISFVMGLMFAPVGSFFGLVVKIILCGGCMLLVGALAYLFIRYRFNPLRLRADDLRALYIKMFAVKDRGTFRHLGYADRIKIEVLRKTGTSVRDMAAYIGCSVSTIYRELKRGQYKRLTSELVTVSACSADIAQKDYDYKTTAKGAA